MKRLIFATLFFSLSVPTLLAQSGQLSDRIVAVVNDHVILKSDVDSAVIEQMRSQQRNNQPVQFEKEMWYQALESLVDKYVMLEKAEIDSVVVSDERVDRGMDEQIGVLIERLGSEQALEREFGQSIVQLRADVRENFREEMIIEQLRSNKIQSITITRPEVRQFFNSIPEDSMPKIPDQVSISHIVKIPPPLEDAKAAALRKIETIRDSIVLHDKSFEEMAREYSDSPEGREGGHVGMLEMSDLVPSYSAAAAALEPGEVSGVVETEFGYHIIRLNRRVGDSIDTHNLLVTIDESSRDNEFAIQQLNMIRDSVLVEEKSFSEMARKHSEDDATRTQGGRIFDPQSGSRLIPVNQLDPAIYRVVLMLNEPGDISEPQPFNPQNPNVRQAFRIVRLDQFIPEHVASFEEDYDRIMAIALQRKRVDKYSSWLQKLRDEVYVEYKIDVPSRYQQSNPEFHDPESSVEVR